MPRPRKKGLNYFPLDADIFEDEKFFDVQNEYGPLGEVIYLRLICLVYKHGYYYKFDSKEKLAAMLMRSIGNRWVKDKKTVIGVIDYLAEINLFSSELMQRSVLTSRGIQVRYLAATERRQSNICEYSLLENDDIKGGSAVMPVSGVTVTDNGVSDAETGVDVSNKYTKESKVNESKVNESKEEETAEPSQSPSPHDALVYDYGSENVEKYTARVRSWYAEKGKPLPDIDAAVRRWMEQDGVPKADHSMDKYKFVINRFMK